MHVLPIGSVPQGDTLPHEKGLPKHPWMGMFQSLVNLDQEPDRVQCIVNLYSIPLDSPDLA